MHCANGPLSLLAQREGCRPHDPGNRRAFSEFMRQLLQEKGVRMSSIGIGAGALQQIQTLQQHSLPVGATAVNLVAQNADNALGKSAGTQAITLAGGDGQTGDPPIHFLIGQDTQDPSKCSKNLAGRLDPDPQAFTPEQLKVAKKNMEEILAYVPDDIKKKFSDNGGKLNLAPFRGKDPDSWSSTNAFTDPVGPDGPSVTFNLHSQAVDLTDENLSEDLKIKYASTFAHEAVHAGDASLTGTPAEKAAGSVQEEMDADMAKFRVLQDAWQKGKIDSKALFGDPDLGDNGKVFRQVIGKNGETVRIRDIFDINEQDKTFKLSETGEVIYRQDKYDAYQIMLEKNPDTNKAIYDRNNDGFVDLGSLGHEYKGPPLDPEDLRVVNARP